MTQLSLSAQRLSLLTAHATLEARIARAAHSRGLAHLTTLLAGDTSSETARPPSADTRKRSRVGFPPAQVNAFAAVTVLATKVD